MKSKFSVAAMLAAIFLIASCDLFQTKKRDAQNNLLYGKYELINISDTPTTTALQPGGKIKGYFNSMKDTMKLYADFGSDSVVLFNYPNDVDTGKYYVDTASKIAYIQQSGVFNMYHIIPETDSIITLANDSIYFVFRKS